MNILVQRFTVIEMIKGSLVQVYYTRKNIRQEVIVKSCNFKVHTTHNNYKLQYSHIHTRAMHTSVQCYDGDTIYL